MDTRILFLFSEWVQRIDRMARVRELTREVGRGSGESMELCRSLLVLGAWRLFGNSWITVFGRLFLISWVVPSPGLHS